MTRRTKVNPICYVQAHTYRQNSSSSSNDNNWQFLAMVVIAAAAQQQQRDNTVLRQGQIQLRALSNLSPADL